MPSTELALALERLHHAHPVLCHAVDFRLLPASRDLTQLHTAQSLVIISRYFLDLLAQWFLAKAWCDNIVQHPS